MVVGFGDWYCQVLGVGLVFIDEQFVEGGIILQDFYWFMGIEVCFELFGSVVLDGVVVWYVWEQVGMGEIGKDDGYGVV